MEIIQISKFIETWDWGWVAGWE